MNIMIDLETLSSNNDAVILQIGACTFDDDIQDLGKDSFKATIDIDSCIRAGMSISGDTLRWWLEQAKINNELVKQVFSGDMHIQMAVHNFNMWCRKFPRAKVWSNPAQFDIVILRDVFHRHARKLPFHYRNERDMRTLRCMYELMFDKKVEVDHPLRIPHDALDDAVYQAKVVQKILAETRGLTCD